MTHSIYCVSPFCTSVHIWPLTWAKWQCPSAHRRDMLFTARRRPGPTGICCTHRYLSVLLNEIKWSRNTHQRYWCYSASADQQPENPNEQASLTYLTSPWHGRRYAITVRRREPSRKCARLIRRRYYWWLCFGFWAVSSPRSYWCWVWLNSWIWYQWRIACIYLCSVQLPFLFKFLRHFSRLLVSWFIFIIIICYILFFKVRKSSRVSGWTQEHLLHSSRVAASKRHICVAGRDHQPQRLGGSPTWTTPESLLPRRLQTEHKEKIHIITSTTTLNKENDGVWVHRHRSRGFHHPTSGGFLKRVCRGCGF